jgi:ATP-dependent Clp protease ATP-binding subunit ClpC
MAGGLFAHFSKQSKQVLATASALARNLERPLSTEMLLLGLLDQPDTGATLVLNHAKVDREALATHIIERAAQEKPLEATLAPETIHACEDAFRVAVHFKYSIIEPEHLLLALVHGTKNSACLALRAQSIDPESLAKRLVEWFRSVDAARQRTEEQQEERNELPAFLFDLTEAAANQELDPVAGRDDEIERLISILLRRRKNSPVLLGDAGVGKSAVVEGLAQWIVRGRVPAPLKNKRIVTLDLATLVAGTQYRGQFEERITQLIRTTKERGDVILFIDELHTLVGTGSAEGAGDAANILKPALARGEISVIGATTHAEYRTRIAKDKALARRFETVSIDEPTEKAALLMLKSQKPKLEAHHRVVLTPEALQAAITLSERYVHDRRLPDKALDILDEAATHYAWEQPEDPIAGILQDLEQVAEKKQQAFLDAESDADWESLRSLAQHEQKLVEELEAARTRERLALYPPITDHHIATVISRRLGIPVSQIKGDLTAADAGRIKATLESHILGQNTALDQLTNSLTRVFLGLQPAGKPYGAYLLVGPTGVGKTETARILARELFGSDDALTKVDMSEFGERHTVSTLIGAPAGYVGYEQGGTLTESVRRRPYQVVLFDEVEKAHPDVFNILLQVLDDGTLTDSAGESVDFSHTLIILTSNLGMQEYKSAGSRIGFAIKGEQPSEESEQEALEQFLKDEVHEAFRPEFIGRLSGIIVYRPLIASAISTLVKRRAKQLKDGLKAKGYKLKLTPILERWIADHYEPTRGARSLETIFLHQVEPPLFKALMEQSEVTDWTLTITDDNITAAPNTPNEASKPAIH